MSIFGSGQPKIIDASSNTINLDYCQVLRDEPVENNELFDSSVDSQRAAIVRGHNWVMEVLLNIYKKSDSETYFQTLYALRGTNVTLFRHRDGEPFKDSSGSNVSFKVMRVQHLYVGDYYYNNEDAVILEFQSLKPVDFAQFTSTLLSDTGSAILSDDGTGILLD